MPIQKSKVTIFDVARLRESLVAPFRMRSTASLVFPM